MEETIYLVDDEEQGDEVRTVKKQSEMLFLRGIDTTWSGHNDIRIRVLTDGQEIPSFSSRRNNNAGAVGHHKTPKPFMRQDADRKLRVRARLWRHFTTKSRAGMMTKGRRSSREKSVGRLGPHFDTTS